MVVVGVTLLTLNEAGANCGPSRFLIQPAQLEDMILKLSQVRNATGLSQVLDPPPGRPTEPFGWKLRLCICTCGRQQKAN